jgi:pimeloyl-ACP methyl ester carboxylesterase
LRLRPWLVVAGLAVGLAVGLGIDVARSGGLDTWLALRGMSPPYDARGRTLEVAGADVYLDCRGAGSPTVILENGLGSGAGGWGAVLDGVAATTRVCAWERPGIGRSEARPLHSGRDTAGLLRATLAAAGESGPYVVVGHSLGGVYGRLFAATPQPGQVLQPRDAVLAFVMIDTFEPDLGVDADPALSEELRANVRRAIDETGAAIQAQEALDWATTMAELAALGPVEQGGISLWVDPNVRFGEPDPDDKAAIIAAWYRGVAARYPNMDLEIVPNTGHVIQLERPSLVTDRIRAVVLGVRTP